MAPAEQPPDYGLARPAGHSIDAVWGRSLGVHALSGHQGAQDSLAFEPNLRPGDSRRAADALDELLGG